MVVYSLIRFAALKTAHVDEDAINTDGSRLGTGEKTKAVAWL